MSFCIDGQRMLPTHIGRSSAESAVHQSVAQDRRDLESFARGPYFKCHGKFADVRQYARHRVGPCVVRSSRSDALCRLDGKFDASKLRYIGGIKRRIGATFGQPSSDAVYAGAEAIDRRRARLR